LNASNVSQLPFGEFNVEIIFKISAFVRTVAIGELNPRTSDLIASL
jgi:hypothetical protein